MQRQFTLSNRQIIQTVSQTFCQAIYKGIEGKEWEELHFHYREMSKAAEARKPSESHKAKAFWAMKAAKDTEKEFYDPARTGQHFGKESGSARAVGRAPQRPTCGTGQGFEVLGESVSRLSVGSRPVVELVLNGLWPRGRGHGAKGVGQAFVEKCLPYLDPCDGVRLRTASTHWNVPGKYGPHGELFFFLLKQEPTVISGLVVGQGFFS